MAKKCLLPQTGTASFLVISGLLLLFVFYKEFQLKTGTKKIEWMAGTWMSRKPKPFGSKKKKDEHLAYKTIDF
jgi:hypothetical protein